MAHSSGHLLCVMPGPGKHVKVRFRNKGRVKEEFRSAWNIWAHHGWLVAGVGGRCTWAVKRRCSKQLGLNLQLEEARPVSPESVSGSLETDELIWGTLWNLGSPLNSAPREESEQYELLGQLACALKVL